jgi:hypothetical protein
VYRQRLLQIFYVVEEYIKRRQEFISDLIEKRQLKCVDHSSFCHLWGDYGIVPKWFADSL